MVKEYGLRKNIRKGGGRWCEVERQNCVLEASVITGCLLFLLDFCWETKKMVDYPIICEVISKYSETEKF